jgi:hypothetical protein
MTVDDQADRGAALPAVDRQIRALTEIIGLLAEALSRLSARVDNITAEAQSRISANDDELAPWVWEHPDATANDPESVVESFVTFYNRTYVGIDGSRARPIPICWKDHPALVAEVATLAYSWRTANVGTTANVRDAQYWLHQWRPAFTDRLVRDWLPMDCFEGAQGHDALFTASKPFG